MFHLNDRTENDFDMRQFINTGNYSAEGNAGPFIPTPLPRRRVENANLLPIHNQSSSGWNNNTVLNHDSSDTLLPNYETASNPPTPRPRRKQISAHPTEEANLSYKDQRFENQHKVSFDTTLGAHHQVENAWRGQPISYPDNYETPILRRPENAVTFSNTGVNIGYCNIPTIVTHEITNENDAQQPMLRRYYADDWNEQNEDMSAYPISNSAPQQMLNPQQANDMFMGDEYVTLREVDARMDARQKRASRIETLPNFQSVENEKKGVKYEDLEFGYFIDTSGCKKKSDSKTKPEKSADVPPPRDKNIQTGAIPKDKTPSIPPKVSRKHKPVLANNSVPVLANNSGPVFANNSGPVLANNSGPVFANNSGPVLANNSGDNARLKLQTPVQIEPECGTDKQHGTRNVLDDTKSEGNNSSKFVPYPQEVVAFLQFLSQSLGYSTDNNLFLNNLTAPLQLQIYISEPSIQDNTSQQVSQPIGYDISANGIRFNNPHQFVEPLEQKALVPPMRKYPAISAYNTEKIPSQELSGHMNQGHENQSDTTPVLPQRPVRNNRNTPYMRNEVRDVREQTANINKISNNILQSSVPISNFQPLANDAEVGQIQARPAYARVVKPPRQLPKQPTQQAWNLHENYVFQTEHAEPTVQLQAKNIMSPPQQDMNTQLEFPRSNITNREPANQCKDTCGSAEPSTVPPVIPPRLGRTMSNESVSERIFRDMHTPHQCSVQTQPTGMHSAFSVSVSDLLNDPFFKDSSLKIETQSPHYRKEVPRDLQMSTLNVSPIPVSRNKSVSTSEHFKNLDIQINPPSAKPRYPSPLATHPPPFAFQEKPLRPPPRSGQ